MSSNQIQIKYMVEKLKEWNENLGGNLARRAMSSCEFDYLQENFLTQRHNIQKLQDQKEKEGLTSKNAYIANQIREGIPELNIALGKLKEQLRRNIKKKKDTPEILSRRQKIVDNCELLIKDIEQRQQGSKGLMKPNKMMTLTDMRARLLSEIDEQNEQIHQGSEGALIEVDDQQEREMQKMKDEDEKQDNILDEIITVIKQVKTNVKEAGFKQDQIDEKIKKNRKKVQKNSHRIQTDNQKLKKIIKDFSSNRCCIIAVLFLMLVGLIVVIIKLFI